MNITKELSELIHSVAEVASNIKRKAFYYLGFGSASAIYMGWSCLDFKEVSGFDIFITCILALPLLIWLLFYSVANQLANLPDVLENIEELQQDGAELLNSFSNKDGKEKSKGSKIYALVKMLRKPEILEFVIDSVKGISLLINPILLALLFISSVCIFIYILTAVVLFVF